MGKLDFSALNQLAYRGFESEEAQAEKDRLIEQGFTVVENDKGNPFTATQTASENLSAPPASAASQRASGAPRSAPERKAEDFVNVSGTRNYKTLYRIAHDFHKRHAPPTLEAGYWDQTAEDMTAIANANNNDPFLIDLLTAIYEELEREYKLLGSSASGRP